MYWKIYPYKGWFFLLFVTNIFASHTWSFQTTNYRVHFIDSLPHWRCTFSKFSHTLVHHLFLLSLVFENASSRTLFFNVIFPLTSSYENLFTNASTSFVRVKSPQESPALCVPLMNNIFQCTWMDNKGIEPLIWLYLASL